MVRVADDPTLTDRSEALMREVGAQLREVRMERGEDLDEVAAYLRIKPLYLYGIERGDMSVMPGRTYALGFLRTYADYLGFDGEDLIEQIKSTVSDLTGRTRFHIRAPMPEGRVPKMPLLVASLAMVAGIYAGWAYINRADELGVEQIPPVPEELQPLPPPSEAPGAETEGDVSAPGEPGAPGGPDPTVAEARGTATTEAPPAGDEPAAVARATPESGGAAGTNDEGDVALDDPATPPAVPDEEVPGQPADEQVAAIPSDEIGPPGETAPPVGADVDPTAADLAALEPAAGPSGTAGEEAGADPLPDDGEAGRAGDDLADPGSAVEEPGAPPDESGDGASDAPAATAEEAPGAGSEDLVAALLAELADGEGQVYETVNADARVILRATGQSWVQIRSRSGDYLRTRTLQRGDTFLVPNRDDLVMWTGNAGAVEFVVDGEPIAPLGPDGRVIRDIPLAPAALLERARQPG